MESLSVGVPCAPTPGGWFGREGLEITAVFAFEPEPFERYRSQAA